MTPIKKSTLNWSLTLILSGGLGSVFLGACWPYAVGVTLAYLLICAGALLRGL